VEQSEKLNLSEVQKESLQIKSVTRRSRRRHCIEHHIKTIIDSRVHVDISMRSALFRFKLIFIIVIYRFSFYYSDVHVDADL